MRGRLQHPSLGGAAGLPLLPLQELQHPVQVVVGRREVLPVDPGAVFGQVRTRLRHVGQERVGQEDDLLLGFARVHRMDREQLGSHLARRRLALLADDDARILGVGPGVVELGRDLDDLPAVGAVKARVGCQKSLQQRGAAAHHPDDHDGRGDGLLRDLRMPADPLLRAQSHPQAVHDSRSQDVAPDVVEVGRRIALRQLRQRCLERQRPEVGQPLLLLGGRQQSIGVEGGLARHAAQNFRWWLVSPTWSTNMIRVSNHHSPSTRWKVSR